MQLRKALARVADVPRPEAFDDFRRHIDPAWVREALAATGTATLRRRRLPAEQVVWLVLGMALFRNRSITEVAGGLDLALPARRGPTAAPSAVSQARTRLGEEPMAALFDTCAQHWAHTSADRHRWRGLALYGIDGTTLRVWDSAENRAHFGLPGSGRDKAAYPQVRLVVLAALRSHPLAAAAVGACTTGEGTLAEALWPKLPEGSLCIVDRNFLAAHVLLPLARDGADRHWLLRAKKNLRWRELERLGRNDVLVEMKVSHSARRKDPSLLGPGSPAPSATAIPAPPPQWLLTSLLDPKTYPAREIVALYHERWEIEGATTRSRPRCSTARRRSAAAPRSGSVRRSGGSCWHST